MIPSAPRSNADRRAVDRYGRPAPATSTRTCSTLEDIAAIDAWASPLVVAVTM